MTKPSKWSWSQLVFGLNSENSLGNLCVLTKHFYLQVHTGIKQNDLMAMIWWLIWPSPNQSPCTWYWTAWRSCTLFFPLIVLHLAHVLESNSGKKILYHACTEMLHFVPNESAEKGPSLEVNEGPCQGCNRSSASRPRLENGTLLFHLNIINF